LGGVEAARDQVGQQRRGHGGVLGRALPQPERDLDALGGDPERHDVRVALELDSIEHQHGEAHVVEATSHERREVLSRAGDELARDRRLRSRALRVGDLRSHRLLGAREAARRDPTEHPLEHGIHTGAK